MNANSFLTAVLAGVGLAGAAHAQTNVPAGTHGSEHWTLAGSPYRLQGIAYFTGGATLDIDAGVIVASLPADQGTIVICRGSRINVNGTQSAPVIMTSTNDVATWTGTTGSGSSQIPGDPKTGTWRPLCNEWGNLTIMGNAYISENAILGNVATPNFANVADMEGLTNGPATDRYGGGDDDDNSGTIRYLSLRYGGKISAPSVELNGLSLGGVGRGTNIDHIDIMNNLDDGIEIWGGTCNFKYVNIWNIGDDSFDIDQGWRGKAQFGLIVQGYSRIGAQGSGVGDNSFEMDGAEDSDWQPVTTAVVDNFTIIGQPVEGDQATAWRDNARVQFHNCIFMDTGEQLVAFDNIDGNGAQGYGFNGTLTWAQTWTTSYTATSTVNAPANPAAFYTAQSTGNLAEITDSVFYRNLGFPLTPPTPAKAELEAANRGVTAGINNNVLLGASSLLSDQPIVSITRGTAPGVGSGFMAPVIGLDPRPANSALTSVGTAPNDGFFTQAQYRGAFAPRTESWLCGWTASYAYGYTTACDTTSTPLCSGDGTDTACPCSNPGSAGRGCENTFGTGGASLSSTGGASLSNDTLVLHAANTGAFQFGLYFEGSATANATAPFAVGFGNGLRCVNFTGANRLEIRQADGAGASATTVMLHVPGFALAGTTYYYQLWYRDGVPPTPIGTCLATAGFNFSNAIKLNWVP